MAETEEEFEPSDDELVVEAVVDADLVVELGEDADDEIALVDADADISVEEVVEAEDEADIVEEEFDREDVEVPLDKILEQRTGGAPLAPEAEVGEEPTEEVVIETDERGVLGDGVAPKRPGEFTCASCFLVKHPSQLADPKRMLCRDCV